VNEKLSWKILVNKKGDNDKSLADARFALYTANKELAPGEDSSIANASGARRELTIDDTTWYLMDAQVTNKNGQIQWEGLMEDEYYLLELEAPEGYTMNEEPGQVVTASWGGTQEVEVINYCQYELPYTGGMGTALYSCTGLGLVLLSTALLRLRKKKTII
jgi:LPXTG-motif cell wall-anchored protein